MIEFTKLSKVFNALIPNTANKPTRVFFYERGAFGMAQMSRPLDEAIQQRDAAKISALLDQGANPSLCTHFTGPALNEAVKTCDMQIMRLLTDRGADVHAANKAGTTPLHLAVAAWDATVRPQMIAHLLSLGANPLAQNCFGDTPMDTAKRNGHNDSIQLMQDYLDKVTKPHAGAPKI